MDGGEGAAWLFQMGRHRSGLEVRLLCCRFYRAVRNAQQQLALFLRIFLLGMYLRMHRRLEWSLDRGSVTLAAFAAKHEDLAPPLAAHARIDLSPECDEVVDRRIKRDQDHEPDGAARDHVH